HQQIMDHLLVAGARCRRKQRSQLRPAARRAERIAAGFLRTRVRGQCLGFLLRRRKLGSSFRRGLGRELTETGAPGEQRGGAQPCACQSGCWNPDSAHRAVLAWIFHDDSPCAASDGMRPMSKSWQGGSMAGTLWIVATPIGNLEDFSPRAQRVLREVALIAAEDTRHSRPLLAHFGIGTPLVSLHEHNERDAIAPLLARLQAGEDVALISDAGTPLISDPGYRLVRAART